MRRFIKTNSGKAISFVTIVALLLPFLTWITTTRAAAQLVQRDAWAVLEFSDKSGKNVKDLTKKAADSLTSELAKLNRFDMVPSTTVDSRIQLLGLENPVVNRDDIVRLGQNLPANVVVTGELYDYDVVKVGNGKQGRVKMRVIVRDVASGLEINGAALAAYSAVRTSGDVTDENLISDAINSGTFKAVGMINSNTLPKATVLNTTDRKALINKGRRVGFANEQEVIIVRNREAVAHGKVVEVEPDQAFVVLTSDTKGVQPGDSVTVIFHVPDLKRGWPSSGEAGVVQNRSGSSGDSIGKLLPILIVAGILVFLLGQGRSGSSQTINSLSATPADSNLAGNGTRLAVNLSWKPDAFIKEPYRQQWQIWRNDVPDAPVLIVPGTSTSATDDGTNLGGLSNWYDQRSQNTSTACAGLSSGQTHSGTANPQPLVSGTPYQYSIELIYKYASIDNPGASTGSTSGSTGTTSSSTGSTSSSTGSTTSSTTGSTSSTTGSTGTSTGSTGTTTGSSSGDTCYGQTTRIAMSGTVTPFGPTALNAPDDLVTVSTPTVFRWKSSRTQGSTIVLEYALQFSSDALFPAANTTTVATVRDTSSTGFVATTGAIASVLTVYPGVTRIYWRVGVKNASEGGAAYSFGEVRSFNRPTNPPNP